MKAVECDFCGSQEANLLVAQKDIVHYCALPTQEFYLQKCNQCGLVYLSPQLEPEEVSLYCPSLRKNGFEAVGIEPSADARRIAGKYGLKVFSSLTELGNQEFDCIRMNWSLEHVDSPLKYFSAFRGLLKKGGNLVISVPNYSGILYKLFPHCVEIPVHNYYFTPETLEAYFSKFSFGILNKYSFSYPAMFIFAQECLNGKTSLNLNPWEAIYFQSILDKFGLQMLGNDMVYLCQKKGD